MSGWEAGKTHHSPMRKQATTKTPNAEVRHWLATHHLSEASIQALEQLIDRIPPEELITRFRRFFDGFVYNAQGNIELEDQNTYRELDNFLETLRRRD